MQLDSGFSSYPEIHSLLSEVKITYERIGEIISAFLRLALALVCKGAVAWHQIMRVPFPPIRNLGCS